MHNGWRLIVLALMTNAGNAQNPTKFQIAGQQSMLQFGHVDDSITLIRNGSSNSLVCSGIIEAADVRIAGTETTVAELITTVSTLGSIVTSLAGSLAPLSAAVFSTISTTTAGVTADAKYSGAVAVGTRVFFAPRNQDNVGVLDTITDTFSVISTITAGVTADEKYMGAAVIGTRILCAPQRRQCGCARHRH